MNRFINVLLITIIVSVVLSCSPVQRNDDIKDTAMLQRPNILWLSCEDMSPRLGCYGDSIARTPNIDQLAAQGCRFTSVFTSSPVCAPCRAGIITGMYQTSIGAHHMRTTHISKGLPTPYHTVPPHYVKTFTEYLRTNGYYCTNNDKTDYQIGDPFTAWDECGTEAHYKNRPDSSQPFFAVFNFHITHEMHTWGKPYYTNPDVVTVPPYYPDIPEAHNAIAVHYDNIATMDSLIGIKLEELRILGYESNTIVFFWSDHGDGLPRAKRWPYDAGTNIPLIIRWPQQINPGKVDSRLISSIDFGPTVLAMAGVEIPMHMQGEPLFGIDTKPKHKYVVTTRDRFDESYDMVRSIRDKRYRYVRNFYPNQPYVQYIPYRNNSPLMQAMLTMHAAGKLNGVPAQWFAAIRPTEELYDCKKDPHNIVNLADNPQYRQTLERMRLQLDQWMKKTEDMGKMSEEQMKFCMWRGSEQPVTENPFFVINASGFPMQQKSRTGGSYQSPTNLYIYCPTQGASIGYTMQTGDNVHWLLYSGPIHLPPGQYFIRTKAIRYGYKESEETSGTFIIKPSGN